MRLVLAPITSVIAGIYGRALNHWILLGGGVGAAIVTVVWLVWQEKRKLSR